MLSTDLMDFITSKYNDIRDNIKIKNSVLDYIRYKQLNWYGHVQRMDEERNGVHLEEEGREDLEIIECRSYNRNERERERERASGRDHFIIILIISNRRD